MTETTETILNKPTETENQTNSDPKPTEKLNSDLPEVKLSSKDKKRLRNKKYYETKKLNKPTEKAEKRLNKPTEKLNSDIKTSSANSSYIWIVAIIALLSICIFALYLFSHGQGNTGNMVDGLPYY